MKNIIQEAFTEKVDQLYRLDLKHPLLIINLDGQNRNYRMFTGQTDHSAPSFLLFLPNGKIYTIVSPIETSLLDTLKDKIEIVSYTSTQDVISFLQKLIKNPQILLVEYSRYYDLDIISYSWMKKLRNKFRLKSAEGILFPLRTFKTKTEIELIQHSVKTTLKIMEKVKKHIRSGVQELDINNLIYCETLKENLEIAFKPIIAAGPRAINPHPVRATNKKFKKDELVIVDMGLSCYGYVSDITRTFLVGGNIEEHYFYKMAHEMIKKMESLKLSNITPFQLAEEMKKISKKHKVDSHEKHGYGHGIGVAVHDIYPAISTSRKIINQDKFKNRVTFAFEPGFYTDKIGFRWENDYFIKDGKAVRFD